MGFWVGLKTGGGGLYSGWAYKQNKNIFRNDEIKRTVSEKRIKAYIPLHLELVNYINNTFIVHHKATCLSVTFN